MMAGSKRINKKDFYSNKFGLRENISGE